MSAQIPVSSVPPENLRFTMEPDFHTVYANWVQGTSTPFDISLVIGEAFPPMVPQEGDTTIQVSQKFRLIFSPLEAKMVTAILVQTLRAYERQFGTIAVPEVMETELRRNMQGDDKAEGAEVSTEGV